MSSDPILDAIIAHDFGVGMGLASPPDPTVTAAVVAVDLNCARADGFLSPEQYEEHAHFLLSHCIITRPEGRYTVISVVIQLQQQLAEGTLTQEQFTKNIKWAMATAWLDPHMDHTTFLGGYRPPDYCLACQHEHQDGIGHRCLCPDCGAPAGTDHQGGCRRS